MSDLACWIKHRSGKHGSGKDLKAVSMLIAWLDDILTAGSREKINAGKTHLATKFKIKDQGPADVFINIKIKRDRDRRVIYLDQSHYLSLAKAKTQESLSETEKKRYQAMIGSLGYLMNCSRPDIAFAVGKLGLYAG